MHHESKGVTENHHDYTVTSHPETDEIHLCSYHHQVSKYKNHRNMNTSSLKMETQRSTLGNYPQCCK